LSADHFIEIYRNQGEAYHRLIAAEDVEGNLPAALQEIASLDKATILDLGGGSGRIPLLLHENAKQMLSLDLHRDMLREQAVQRKKVGGSWQLAQADLRQIPIADNWADVIIAGWAIGHSRSWHAEDWQRQIGRALAEMQRTAKVGGSLIILETMGTGTESAGPPSPELDEYYGWLEQKHNFQRQVISTDYEFADRDEAVELVAFFFGDELAANVWGRKWTRLPEWTGIWHKENY
jgi:ubiquinone/menaquinone biosynthesis C-methylase UbiE